MIQKILFAVGAVAAFEGILLAVAPNRTVDAMKLISQLTVKSRSYFGLLALAVGVVLMWISGL